MTERTPNAFRQRITLALAALAVIAAVQGGFAIWAVGVSEHHLLRGRVAADIKQSFTDLWFYKQQLRNWMAQRQFGADATDQQRDVLLGRMRIALDRLDELSRQAVLLDDGVAARQRQAQRRDALVVLRASFNQLGRGLSALNQPTPGLDTRSAWTIANDLFDNAEGRDLRALLAESLAREDVALREKRAQTDRSLATLRNSWIATTAVLVVTALLLAAALVRALGRPLRALVEGAAALRAGDLSHRITLDGKDEFGDVAGRMNEMAEELAAHRDRERRARIALEDQVASRTAELTAALDAQTAAEARRRQLFADISHELRTPTTAIRGEAQIALRGEVKPAEEYRQSLRRIEGAARQLGATIDDLLTMARSDMDSLSLRLEPLDLRGVLEEALALGEGMAEARGIRLERGDWPEPLRLRGDADRLKQLFLVLIDNAVRYSHRGGSVTLGVARAEAGVARPAIEVSISDEGIGIADDALGQVFERGYRAPEAAAHCADGSGLGLPIARVLARRHGGDISLARRPDGGTAAIVTLPLLKPAAVEPA